MAHSAQTSPKPGKYANVIAIAASGAFAGGSLLIGMTGFTRWPHMEPLAWQAGFWREFVGFAVGIVPLFLATFIGILISRKNTQSPLARRWWLIALVLWGVNCLITSCYHLPQNLELRALAYTSEEAAAVRTTWLALHVPRVLLAFGTHIAAVWAALLGASASSNSREGNNGEAK